MAFSISTESTLLSQRNEKTDQYGITILNLQYQILEDSTDAAVIKNKIAILQNQMFRNGLPATIKDSLGAAIANEESALFKKKALQKKHSDELEQVKDSLDIFKFNLDGDREGATMLLFAGLVFFLIGGGMWAVKEIQNETIDKRKFQIETKEGPCNSCGMILKYDLAPFPKKGFCSECFDGKNYKQPGLTLQDMTLLVTKRMQEQGSKEKEIKNHIKELARLNRWAPGLRWRG